MRWTGFHLQTAIRMVAVAAAMTTIGGMRLAAQRPVPTSGLAVNTCRYFLAWDSAVLFYNEDYTYRPFPLCCPVRTPAPFEMTMGDVNGPTSPSPSTYGKALASFHLSISDTNGAWLTVLDTLVPGDVFGLYVDGIFQGYSSAVPGFAFENWGLRRADMESLGGMGEAD